MKMTTRRLATGWLTVLVPAVARAEVDGSNPQSCWVASIIHEAWGLAPPIVEIAVRRRAIARPSRSVSRHASSRHERILGRMGTLDWATRPRGSASSRTTYPRPHMRGGTRRIRQPTSRVNLENQSESLEWWPAQRRSDEPR
jgi:hypothetical protein